VGVMRDCPNDFLHALFETQNLDPDFHDLYSPRNSPSS
jgi:hypothetical protein